VHARDDSACARSGFRWSGRW